MTLLALAITQASLADTTESVREKPGVTEISDAPWAPSSPYGPKVIYGEDDRIDVYQETDADRQAWAASTCALIYATRLTQHGDGSYTLSSPAAHRRWGLPPCEGEPFGNQPVAAHCTGFMVGTDLIATAGHCFSTASLAGTRFVFGFRMVDEDVPRLDFLEDEVYQGIEVVSFASSGPNDHSLVRVDRPIRAPGAQPLPLRRDGTIAPGDFVGVIGHPSGLPMKIAFGNTYVRSSDNPGFFVANLDTYGGNSGSPVFNAHLGIVEGILVRGETDYINQGTCFISYNVPDDGGRGEDSTKTTVFAQHVPASSAHSGTVNLDSAFYQCSGIMVVTVTDIDLEGAGMVTVSLDTVNGDVESLELLEENDAPGTFIGAIEIVPGAAIPYSERLEVVHGDIATAAYHDEADEDGMPVEVTASASIDCVPPSIAAISAAFIGGTQARIVFTTDEVARGTVRYGASCADLAFMASSAFNTFHAITLSDVAPDRRYYFIVEAQDRALNFSVDDNGGACHTFHTYGALNYFTEYFNTQNAVDIQFSQLTFLPIDHPNQYQACVSAASSLPMPASGTVLPLGDDDWSEIVFADNQSVSFYGETYDRLFVGSNGYITFGVGDVNRQALPSQHFLVPRISAFMCDLNPEVRGQVSGQHYSDRYVVTFNQVPVYDSTDLYPPENSHTFQIEVFFSGMIRITWMELGGSRAIAGLSAGLGQPIDYASVKISGLGNCSDVEYDGPYHSADTDLDRRISLLELLRVIQFYGAGEYGCDSDSVDGYRQGTGPQDCPPHDSDYNPVNWRIEFNELLRLIQLYNAGGYRPLAGTEDGFSPLP